MAEEKDYNKLLIENNPRMSVMNFFRKLIKPISTIKSSKTNIKPIAQRMKLFRNRNFETPINIKEKIDN